MKVSRASEYSLLAVLAIARAQRQNPGGMVQIKEIADEFDLPHEYVAKLLTTLVKARVLKSERGRDGGFSLRRRASEISVLEIIESVDGPLETSDMLSRVGGDRQVRDNIGSMLNGALGRLRDVLAGSTVDQLLDTPKAGVSP